ncbi:hypothetical protein quinque_013883 [Culex quinquefasciatus]
MGQLKLWLNPGLNPDPGNEVGADGYPAGGSGAPGSGYGTPRTPGNHNNGGKGGNGGETGNEDGDMDRRLAHLERMLSGLTVTVTGMAEQQKSQLNQSQGSNRNALGNPTGSIPKEKPKLRVRRSGLFSPVAITDSSDDDEDFESRKRHKDTAKRGQEGKNRNDDDELSSLLSYGSRGRRRHAERLDDRDLLYRIEKWRLRFFGDNSKFQTLWQNMHSHYRTKIAPGTQIKSLKDLTEACQRIDAVDTSLNPSGEIAHQRMVNNVDVEESENDSEASADVNVVRTRQARDNRYTARRREQPEQEGERENVFRQQPPQHQRTERNQIDPDYEELATKIASNPTEYADYRVIDGRILKYVKSSSRQQDPRFAWKQFPMSEERREIIQQEHDKAHFGFEKTLAAVKQRFFWPKMNEQIRKFCRECLPCQTSKAGNVNVTPPMGSQKPVEYPWQFVTLDYIGPKFVLVQPFREAKAGPLADFVENMIFRLFGVPEIILTDNGSQFVSKIFRGLLESYHVTHWLTPAYHPQVNNTERVNRVITTAIRATLKKEHKHWADDIQAIAAAIRTAVHNSTKEYSRIRDTHAPEATKETEVSAQRKKLFEDVKVNLAAAYQRHAKQYNLRSSSNCPKYAVGEKVLKKTFDLYSIRRLRNLLLRYNPSVSNVRRRNPPYHTRWQKTRQVATCRKKRDVTNALKVIPSGPTRPSGPRGRSSRNDNFRNRTRIC